MVARKLHDDGSDYSGWLLPQVARALTEASAKMADVDLLAVSTGPGSFTGLRVGLTSVKAWAEVYRKPDRGCVAARGDGTSRGTLAIVRCQLL